MQAPEVFVAGALHLDVVVTAPHLPARDETVAGHAVAWRFGGKGGNQAVAAARMGARVAMAGRVGRDGAAATILAALDAAGVDRAAVEAVDGASGMSVAIVDAAGDYGAVIVAGVNAGFAGAAVPAGTRVVMLQSEVPEAANRSVAAAAGAARVMLNAAPARPVDPALLARADILVVNRIEAAALAATDEPEAAAARLRAAGPGVAVVTLGGEGLVAATAAGLLRLPAPRVAVASTHGAGDAFCGALAARLAAGNDLADALCFAQAAAALTVATDPDRRDGLTEAAVRRFMAGS
jgi:ribokinase